MKIQPSKIGSSLLDMTVQILFFPVGQYKLETCGLVVQVD